MSEHEKLCEEAKEAASKLFSDKSVSRGQTKRDLNELVGEIEVMVNTLEDDDEDEDY